MEQAEGNPFVTVVIPMYNEREYIEVCLKSLVEQDYDRGLLEILAVDGMSSDESRSIVHEWGQRYPSIRLLDNPKRITAAALNVGIRAARGSVIVILGAHSHVAPDFVRSNVECLRSSDTDCVGGPLESIGQSFVATTISLAMSSPFGIGNALYRYSEREQLVDTVAFGAYRREVFDRIGLFDESLVKNEDYDLNYRLRQAGGKILLSPKIRSFYYNRASLPKLWKQYFSYGYWKVRMLCKHPQSMAFRQAVPPAFVLSLVLSLSLGLFFQESAYLFVAIVSAYLILSLATSTFIAAKQGWKYLPLLPLIFACLHIAWGTGFLWGVLRWGIRLKAIKAQIASSAALNS